jgi:hypothetical protein
MLPCVAQSLTIPVEIDLLMLGFGGDGGDGGYGYTIDGSQFEGVRSMGE